MPLNNSFHLAKEENKYYIQSEELGVKLEINEPGAYIYERLLEGLPAKKIASKMCLKYVADPVELETDILEFLMILNRNGIYYE